jgi:DNA-binding XRE family transcriptional regulator
MDYRIKSRREQMVSARNGGRDVPELIRELYERDGLSQEEVAERIGVHRATVVRWMEEFGIPTRDRRALAGTDAA